MDWLKKEFKKAKNAAEGQAPAAAAAGPSSAHHHGQPTLHPLQKVDGGRITTQVRELWPQQSTLPHIYRDGGGGGTVDGHHLIIFSDGMYTNGLPPVEPGRMVNFTSNSIAIAGRGAQGMDTSTDTPAIASVTDFGDAHKGPAEAVPFFTGHGESAAGTAIWPNQNIAPIQGGACGVSFPEVIDRNLFRQQKQACLYNTALAIRVQNGKPVVSRPVQSLFRYMEPGREPLFGSFATVGPTMDGYLYLFARIAVPEHPASNGLKLARVRPEAWADRAQYEFWDGQAFGPTVPAFDDGGRANVFSYSQNFFGKHYGAGTGDIFWSHLYGEYILLFQSQAAALDNSVYLSHSSSLTGGWSAPVSIYKLPRSSDGFTYAFHAYPNMDPTGRTVPITWSQDSKAQSLRIGTAEILFS